MYCALFSCTYTSYVFMAVRRVYSAGTMPADVTDTSTSALVTYIHNFSEYSQLHPGVDFLLSTFESWRRSVGHYPKRKFDLVAITNDFVAEKLQEHPLAGRICQYITFDSLHEVMGLENVRALDQGKIHPFSQCWIISHLANEHQEWSTYPLANDIVHIATKKFMTFVSTIGYQMVAKVCTPLLKDLVCPRDGRCLSERGAYSHME